MKKLPLNSILSFVATCITFIVDTILLILVKKVTHPNGGVAVVRIDAIGDFVLWLDAAKEFRKLYPYKKLTLVANKSWVELATLLPYWDEVLSIDRKKLIRNPFYRLKILLQIRRQRFETVIQPTLSREFLYGDSLVRMSGAPIRIASEGDLSNMTRWEKAISDRWFSKLVPASRKPLMEIQRNAEFVRGMGLREFIIGGPLLPELMTLPAGITINQPYFIIFPGALRSWKFWPLKKFGEVLSKTLDSHDEIAVLCGSHEEQDLCERVMHASGKGAINLAGRTSLPELVEIIRRAKFLVGNDTSAIHIAAAVNTPSVCVLGGGHYGRFLPYAIDNTEHTVPVPVVNMMDCFNCNWKCTQPHKKGDAAPCISRITVDQVMNAIDKIHHRKP